MRRLVKRLVSEPKGAPVGRNENALIRVSIACAQCLIRQNRIFGIHVDGLHKPPRLVSSDGKNCCIDGPASTRDFFEFRMESGVARKENAVTTDLDYPAAPKGCVTVPGITSGEMLCGSAERGHESEITSLPPVSSIDVRGTPFFQKIANSEWCCPLRRRKGLRDARYSTSIEMVIVIGLDEDNVDAMKYFESDCRWRITSWAGELNRRRTIAPNWIRQNVHSVGLKEERAVAYPRDRQLCIVGF